MIKLFHIFTVIMSKPYFAILVTFQEHRQNHSPYA